MSRVGPFGTAPQLIERKAGIIDMMVRDQPQTTHLRFWGARTLNSAYGNYATSGLTGAVTQVSELFTVGKSRQFRSATILQRRWSWYGENLKNTSRIAFDPADYAGDIATDLPPDDEYWFVRVQERRAAVGDYLTVVGGANTGAPKMGPIYVVPPPSFFGQNNPTLVLQGTAPANTGCVAGSVPVIHPDIQLPNPMHVVLPRSTCSITITNLDAVDTLLVSTGLGTPMAAVGPSDDPAIVFGSFKELVVAGAGATSPAFSVYAVVALGPVA